MSDSVHAISPWIREVLAIGVDVAIKASVLLLMAVVIDRLLRRHWVLLRSAMWNACLVALLLLPTTAAWFPRLRVHCLPPRVKRPAAIPIAPTSSDDEPVAIALSTESFFRSAADFYEYTVLLSAAEREEEAATPASLDGVAPDHDHGTLADSPPPSEPVVTPAPTEDSARPEVSPDLEASRLDENIGWLTLGVMVYFAGVVILLVRLAFSLLAIRRLRRLAAPATTPTWTEALDRWRDRLGIRRCVTIGCTDRVSVPMVAGWRHPMILLPPSLTGPDSDDHCDAILLHELAHVRRSDFLWQFLLRVAQVIYWPHPLIWVAARLTAIAREQACDALCLHHLPSSAAYRATLIEVAAGLARRRRGGSYPNPTLLATPMARSSRLTRRLRRIDRGRAVKRCLASWPVRSVLTVIALGAVGSIGPIELARGEGSPDQLATTTLPATTAPVEGSARSDQPDSVKPPALRGAAGREWTAGRSIDFRVVHAQTSQPLPGVLLSLSIDRKKRKETTDAQGRYRINLPDKEPWEVIVWVRKPRFVPRQVYFRGFSKHFDLPERYTVRLDPGTTIGGVVRSESGEPIEGASVYIGMPLGEAMDHVHIFEHEVKADAEGRWRCDIMPRDIEGVRLYVRHPEYVRGPNKHDRPTPPHDKLRNMTPVTVMRRGMAVTGKVTDMNGRPIKDARMILGRESVLMKDLPQIRTDEEGCFRFGCARPGKTVVTVYAPGYALDQRAIIVSAVLGPVEFRLGPPHTVHGRVLDPAGKPIAGALASPASWRGLHFLELFKMKTDARGRFRWDNAPPDEVGFYFGKKGYERIPDYRLAPSEVPHLIRLSRLPTVRGRVVDAQTGAAISRFTVIPSSGQLPLAMPWNRFGAKVFGGGRYVFHFHYKAKDYQLRVEADGYKPAVSPEFKAGEGEKVCDLRLEKLEEAKLVRGILRSPDGSPLPGATLVLLFPSEQLMIGNGTAHSQGEKAVRTDKEGRFSIGPQDGPYGIVVTHEHGYVELSAKQFSAKRDITLQLWGRIEGTLLIEGKPAAGQVMSLSSGIHRDLLKRSIKVTHQTETTTDANGRFLFHRVPPRRVQISRGPDRNRATLGLSYETAVNVKSGQTVQVTLGDTKDAQAGRLVVGHVVPPPGSGRKIDWSNKQHGWVRREDQRRSRRSLQKRVAQPREPSSKPRDFKIRREKPRSYKFNVSLDGSFRLDGLPPGTYFLYITLTESSDYRPLPSPDVDREQIGEVEHEFTVPSEPVGRGAPALDLGDLVFKFRKILRPGDQASLFDIPISDAGLLDRADDLPRLKLTDFVGKPDSEKFVLLSFYAPVSLSRSTRLLKPIKAVYDGYRDDDRLIILLIVAMPLRRAHKPFGKDDPRVIQTVGNPLEDEFFESYGMLRTSLFKPKTFLIGPDGTILAADLKGTEIKRAVASALGLAVDTKAQKTHQPVPSTQGIPPTTTRSVVEKTTTHSVLDFRVVHRHTKVFLPGVELKIIGATRSRGKTDDQGRCGIQISDKSQFLFVTAEKEGFVPLKVALSEAAASAERQLQYTLVMEPGVGIGGVVKDPSGKPIKEARVGLNLSRTEPAAGPNARIRISGDIVRTDADGRWRYNRAPANLDGLSLQITYPGYFDLKLSEPTLPPTDKLRDMAAVATLKPKSKGIPVLGTVFDQQGRPLQGAAVLAVASPTEARSALRELLRRAEKEGLSKLLERAKPEEPIETTTDVEGRFCLYVAQPGKSTMIAKAPGRAPELEEIVVRPGMDPLEFRLAPGHTVRGRLVNSRGEPLHGVCWVSAGAWRKYDIPLVHLDPDQEGRFVWSSAPPDKVEFSFMSTDYVDCERQLAPSETEHVISMYRPTHVSGRVLDAETGKSIPTFTLTPVGAIPIGHGSPLWREDVKITPGRFEVVGGDTWIDLPFRFRIEAEDYEPFVSREFKIGEEQVVYDVKLKRARWLTGLVHSSNGKSLADAVVALAPASKVIHIENLSVRDVMEDCTVCRTDGDGWFKLPPQTEPFGVLVVHKEGYARVSEKQLTFGKAIRVKPWGRVEGVVRIGSSPGANLKVGLSVSRIKKDDLPRVWQNYTATTDAKGRFRMECVMPGEGRIHYELDLPEDGKDLRPRPPVRTHGQSVRVSSGQAVRVVIGGTGRPVIGRITLPPALKAEGGFTWNTFFNRVSPKPADPPIPEDVKSKGFGRMAAWYVAWLKGDEEARREASRSYGVLVKPDGMFRVEDVPAGTYTLQLFAAKRGKHRLPHVVDEDAEIASVYHEFVVPEMPEGRSDEPLDLGTLQLRPRKRLKPGDVAPSFDAETLEGKRVKLADFRGKFVLFHMPVLPHGQAVRPLKAVHEAFGHDKRFVMIGVGTGLSAVAIAQKAMPEKKPPGLRAFVGEDVGRSLKGAYGISDITPVSMLSPPAFLIGPDGKIIAADLRGEKIKQTVSDALGASASSKPSRQPRDGNRSNTN